MPILKLDGLELRGTLEKSSSSRMLSKFGADLWLQGGVWYLLRGPQNKQMGLCSTTCGGAEQWY